MKAGIFGGLGASALAIVLGQGGGFFVQESRADEELFGYVKGAEPLPKDALEVVQWITTRNDKGVGHYRAWDYKTEIEYGFTDRLSGEINILGMGIDTKDILIDAYVPGDKKYGFKLSGVEGSLKYNFLSAAKDPIGLSSYFSMNYQTLDPHSGQGKDIFSTELKLLLQKYLMDDQLILVGNVGIESTMAKRKPVDNLPPGFEWPTDPEMEIAFSGALGVSYRVAPKWFVGAEIFYEDEHETQVGLERWSLQAGPNVHYANKEWWATLTWLPQIRGGGLTYPGQADDNLHLIEKTKEEVRFKIGYNF